jgi:hypothetical protein
MVLRPGLIAFWRRICKNEGWNKPSHASVSDYVGTALKRGQTLWRQPNELSMCPHIDNRNYGKNKKEN